MANLKIIRTRITSVKSTRQITAAMKMVAAARLRKAQDKIVRLRPYASKLHDILLGVTQSLIDSEEDNVYGRKSEPEKILIIVVTSNRGLCGGFNSNIIKETRRVISEKYNAQYEKGNLSFIAIGKKGFDYLRRQKLNILEENIDLFNSLTFENVSILAEKIMESFISRQI